MDQKLWGIAFPCILTGLGAERVLAEAAAMGQSEFILCSIIYKSYRLVMPRHPQQIYQLEAGRTFYPVDEAAYEGCQIRPAVTRDWADRDPFREAAVAAEKEKVALSAWVSCFANSRVAAMHPEHAVENLYGAKDRLFLCFNNPEVQKFCLAMFKDLANRYPLASVMADKIPQSMLELDTFGGRVDPILRLVGSICFCEHCLETARLDGIDLAAVRKIALWKAEASRRVPQYVRQALAGDLQGDTEIPLFLLEEPLFAEVLRWRVRRVVRFLTRAREVVREINPACKFSAAVVPPVKIGHDATAPRAWLAAQSYQAFAGALDTIHSVIHWNRDVVEYDTRRARDAIDNSANPECELCVHLAAYGRRRPEEMRGLAVAAVAQGADSLAFFCHDLLDDRMLAALQSLAN